jgi:uncharacterized protein (TIGR03435 family)
MKSVLIITIASALYAQTPTFEAASIRPADSIISGGIVGSKGGPGTDDPGLYTCSQCSLAGLIEDAYDLPHYRVTAPRWMSDVRFNVRVRVPDGSTKEAFHAMYQNLLITRFKLEVHRETKEMMAYRLVIAKGGIKMIPSIEVQQSTLIGVPNVMITPATPPVKSKPGWARWPGKKTTIAEIADFLAANLKGNVEDATGLTGVYDFMLSWDFNAGRATTNPDPEQGPDLFQAVQEQLGLKLEPHKGPVEIVVVDHAERTPTEN